MMIQHWSISCLMVVEFLHTPRSQVITVEEWDNYQQSIVEYIIDPANRRQFIERGIYLPNFRLPNEAEWEYAAKATIGTVYLDENEEYGRIYPWDGRGTRTLMAQAKRYSAS